MDGTLLMPDLNDADLPLARLEGVQEGEAAVAGDSRQVGNAPPDQLLGDYLPAGKMHGLLSSGRLAEPSPLAIPGSLAGCAQNSAGVLVSQDWGGCWPAGDRRKPLPGVAHAGALVADKLHPLDTLGPVAGVPARNAQPHRIRGLVHVLLIYRMD